MKKLISANIEELDALINFRKKRNLNKE